METPRSSLDAIVDAFKRDIDRTLIRENLQRTVEERFENLMAVQRFADELRAAGRRVRTPHDRLPEPPARPD